MFLRPLIALLVVVVTATSLSPAVAAEAAGGPIALDGTWSFRLDPADRGIAERWFAADLPERIKLPGALQAQGFGDEVSVETKWTGGIVDRSWFTAPEYEKYRQPGNIKVPFWLQPEKHYVGAAWYQRTIEVPAAWQGRHAVLHLERPHWETRVWVDEHPAGSNNGLSTPHDYDLGPLTPGKHRLTIRVDNRMVVDVGENSHSVSDHTQGNWNGIVGQIELRSRPDVWIERQWITARNDGTLTVGVVQRNSLFDPPGGTAECVVREKGTGKVVGKGSKEFQYGRGATTDGRHIFAFHSILDVPVKLDAPPKLWSEFTPELYEVLTTLTTMDGKSVDRAVDTFAFREIVVQGTQFTLNGRKIFLRGTLDCCIFPATGHPPTDVDSWKRIVTIAKAHGLNHIRFHSWCPPEAAFVAADELGFYFQVEASSWANQSTTLGDGKPVDQWLYDETRRILAAYGNHPSFLLMLYGNEPGGKNHQAWLAQYVEKFKAEDPRRLWSSGAGWPMIAANQFHVTPHPRIQAWGGGLKSRINARPPETRSDYRDYIAKQSVPVVSHEIGQWCVYPNFDEMPKYTGYLKPRNFEIFRESLAAHGMADQAQRFVQASGKLQTLCYKEDIESALRTPGMAGFQLLDLHDFPGQGTALVGVLDPFWDGKGYVTADEYRRFAGSTVPLARLGKRVFTTAETLEAEIEVAHFGPAPLTGAVAAWRLADERTLAAATAAAKRHLYGGYSDSRGSETVLPAAAGKLPAKTIPIGNGLALGTVTIPLADVPAPRRYKLVVTLEGTPFENDWDVWVYPAEVGVQPPAGVKIARELDDQTLAALNQGGKVLLLVPPAGVKGDKHGKVALGFSSIFWNTAWTRRQPPHTLGILCDPQHPALAAFPTDDHSNWQWWYLVSRAGAMILDDLPPALRPTVQVIDDWFTNRRLGLVFEAKLGKGSLLVCSVDLQKDAEQNPVARQMLHSLLTYMGSERFAPTVELSVEQVRGLVGPVSNLRKLGAKATADSAAPGYEPENAIDGDPATVWHTRWEPNQDPMPHELVIDLGQSQAIAGIKYLPRQDMTNGRIARAEVYCSADAKQWGQPAAKATWPNSDQWQTVRFAAPATVRYVKIVAHSEVRGNFFAAIAEVDVF